MNNTHIITSIILILGLTSCGSNPSKRKNTANEVFVTQIKPDNSKIFNYSLIKKMPNQGQKGMGKGMGKGGGKHGGMGGGNKGGKKADLNKMKVKMKEKAYKKLNMKLAETGYCREGYMELDSFFERGHVTIKGECNESATEQDHKTFINTDD